MDTNELGNITHSLDHVFNHEYSYAYIIKIIENPQLHHLITEPYSKMKTVQEYISRLRILDQERYNYYKEKLDEDITTINMLVQQHGDAFLPAIMNGLRRQFINFQESIKISEEETKSNNFGTWEDYWYFLGLRSEIHQTIIGINLLGHKSLYPDLDAFESKVMEFDDSAKQILKLHFETRCNFKFTHSELDDIYNHEEWWDKMEWIAGHKKSNNQTT